MGNPNLAHFHHVGIACIDIAATRTWVHATHDVINDSGIVYDAAQKAELCLISTPSMRIELVAGAAVKGTIGRGQSLYHLCYEVETLDAALRQLADDGCIQVSRPTPAVLFDGRRVAFMLGPLGLFELLESV